MLLAALAVIISPSLGRHMLMPAWALGELLRHSLWYLAALTHRWFLDTCQRTVTRMVWDSTGTRSSTTHVQALADGIMLVLCDIWRVMGGHHAIQGTVSALILRVMVALAGYWWQPYSTTFSLLFALYSEVRYLRTAAIYCKLL